MKCKPGIAECCRTINEIQDMATVNKSRERMVVAKMLAVFDLTLKTPISGNGD